MRTAALVAASLCVLGSAIAAVLHANPALVGGQAALAFAAVALWAGATAASLGAPNDCSEARHARGPSPAAPVADASLVTRRGLFGRWLWVTLGAFATAAIVPLVSLGRAPKRGGTAWRRGARLVTPDGRALRADDLASGAIETVFPEGHVGARESAVVLIRLDDGLLQVSPERKGWAPNGNVAYSKVCTHAGCPVALYRKASYELYCPCHQSVFDVVFGAAPKAGPATRALPQLAIAVDRDGYLVAQGDFADPVGPDAWWRPA